MKTLVNGKEYKLWNQFVDGKEKWIGGTLQDFGDSMDIAMDLIDGSGTTIINDITLRPNGDDSAFFSVDGEEFGCGFDVSCGGIAGGEEGWTTFSGYGGHTWRIKREDKSNEK